MGLRHKSIRLRVFLLVMIPILSLIGVYAFAATTTVSAAVSLSRAKTVKNVIAAPAGALQTQLDKERGLALQYLAAKTQRALGQFTSQVPATNRAVRAFETQEMSGALAANASAQEKQYAAQLVTDAKGLSALRSYVEATTISRPAVLTQYSNIVTAAYRVLEGAVDQYTNVPLVNESLTLIKLDEVYQVLLQESDLFASDLTSRAFPPADRAEFTGLVAVRQYLVSDTLPQLTPTVRDAYNKYVPRTSAATLSHLESAIIHGRARRGLPPVGPITWGTAVTTYSVGLGKALTIAADEATAGAQAQAKDAYLRLGLAGGLGLLAIIVSILFSILVGRGLIRQLAELRQSALELANDRLPSVMARLRNGEDVDVAAETPAVESSADEIDQVRQAFNIVQRTAIEAAVDEATLRRGVSDVFRNLARRSQVLLHRQLRLLDGMERRASEPDELEDLFRIDHLTTRMRRHAEGLIILSGESPGRTWRHPVPLMDVLRAAVAEVEDYTRIRVESRTRAALSGQAVADVIHLIAELAENATVFSPPNTPVRIMGDTVGRGFAVEIEDRGLGITEDRLAEINRNLASPPVFDLSGSDRLGLFIAGQLARRHDISITLRPSAYGGTTAIVIIPLKLLVSEDAYERVPAIGADGRSLSAGGRHAFSDTGENGLGMLADPRDARELPPADDADVWAPPPSVTALPGGSEFGAPLTAAPASSPSGSMPPEDFPGLPGAGMTGSGVTGSGVTAMPTVPSPRQPAPPEWVTPGSVTPLPTAEEPGWWTKPSAAQPVMSDTGPGGEGDAVAHGPAGNGAGGNGSHGNGTNGYGAADSFAPPLTPPVTQADLGGYDLPVRVRQASLAPQLRDKSLPADDAPAAEATPASAEAARNTMAALQRGWELGRSTADLSGEPAADENAADENAADGADQ
jgi:signal transduction histidine kinase